MDKQAKSKRKSYRPTLKYYPDLAFMDHVKELRHRLMLIAIGVLGGASIAYFIQQQLVGILLKPSHGQHFIYTSPIGGISFLFNVCLYFGLAISIPVIIYELLLFIEPIIKPHSKKVILKFSLISGFLALVGIVLGYIFGLPIALNFLAHQFITKQIQPLFTIQEYLGFVTFYLLGAAMLFQIPLIIYFINHIKPLKPRKLLRFERYVIVAAFIVSALMAPTINVLNQLIIAGPIILMYQLSIAMVWFKNRQPIAHYNRKVNGLKVQDQEKQNKRSEVPTAAMTFEYIETYPDPEATSSPYEPKPSAAAPEPQPAQPRVRRIDDFRPNVFGSPTGL